MKTKTLFSEQQRFRQPWLWICLVILLCIPAVFLWGVIQQVVLGYPWGDHPMGNFELVIIFASVFLLAGGLFVLFLVTRLDTSVSGEGICVRFYPFRRSFRCYPWEEISRAYVRKYSPLAEFGGWGVRLGKKGWGFKLGFTGVYLNPFNKRNVGYNISGNMGLQLEFTNGRRLLIGTQKAYELGKALKKAEQMNQKNQSNIQ